MTIDLNDKSNLVCVSISPQLTNDTLFIKEDFSPEELSDFFYKRQQQKHGYILCLIVCINHMNCVTDQHEEKTKTKQNQSSL